MSRIIDKSDLSTLSDDDLYYLHTRGEISTAELANNLGTTSKQVASGLKQMLGAKPNPDDVAHTGDANTRGLTKEEHEAQVAALRGEADEEEGEEGDDEPIVSPPYDAAGVTNDHLRAEIARRNEGRDEDDQLSLDGNKASLIETLEADDEASDEDEE